MEVDTVTSDRQATKLLVPLLLPHEVFAEVCSHGDVFKESYFGGSPREFWEKVAFEFPDHPVVQGPQCTRETAVPLGLHGDGACFTKTKMDGLECISWNSILAPAGDSVNTHTHTFWQQSYPLTLSVRTPCAKCVKHWHGRLRA